MMNSAPAVGHALFGAEAPLKSPIIIGAAAVLDILMQELQVSEIAVSGRGLRDGLLMDDLSRRQSDYWQMSVRLRSVLYLGRHASLRVVNGKKIILSIQAVGDCQFEMWGVQGNRAAFEKEFDRTLVIERVEDRPK